MTINILSPDKIPALLNFEISKLQIIVSKIPKTYPELISSPELILSATG